MDSWEKIKDDLEEGVNIAKKGAKLLAERAVTEAEIIKHKIQIKSIDSKIEKQYTLIGETVFEELLKENNDIAGIVSVKESCVKVSEFLVEREKEESRIEESRTHQDDEVKDQPESASAKAEEPAEESAKSESEPEPESAKADDTDEKAG